MQQSARSGESSPAGWLPSLAMRRDEPYAAESVVSVGVLALAPCLLFVVFAIAGIGFGGLIGDCFDNCPPANAAYIYGWYGWMAIVAIPVLPLVGVRALFGDHVIALVVLTVWALALLAASGLTALDLMSVPELVPFGILAVVPGLAIVTVALIAWRKWWTTRAPSVPV